MAQLANGFVKVAKLQDIPPGKTRIYSIDDESVALCNVDGKFYAISNVCSHDDGPLGEGSMQGFEVECPRHGARFDVRTGAATAMPAAIGIDTFETRVDGDDIYVKMTF